MQFKDIVGQRHVINHMTDIIDSGRISHAQLFVGEAASGALPLAIAYGQYLNCQNRQHNEIHDLEHELRADSCGVCPCCKKYRQLTHPDLHLIFPTVTTDDIKSSPSSQDFMNEFRTFMEQTHQYGSLDDWHLFLNVGNKQGMIRDKDVEEVQKVMGMTSYEGGWKVLVVWMAEKMNITVANKLLKVLEEPSERTLFVLVTTNRDHMLSTVLSRVQQLNIPLLTSSELVPETKAAKLNDSGEQERHHAEMFVTWMRQLFKLNMSSLSLWVEQMHGEGREAQKRFLLYAQDSIRACLMCHLAGIPMDRSFGDDKFDASFPNMITINNAEGLCRAFNDAQYSIERNAYAKITFMELSFSISKLLKRR